MLMKLVYYYSMLFVGVVGENLSGRAEEVHFGTEVVVVEVEKEVSWIVKSNVTWMMSM